MYKRCQIQYLRALLVIKSKKAIMNSPIIPDTDNLKYPICNFVTINNNVIVRFRIIGNHCITFNIRSFALSKAILKEF